MLLTPFLGNNLIPANALAACSQHASCLQMHRELIRPSPASTHVPTPDAPPLPLPLPNPNPNPNSRAVNPLLDHAAALDLQARHIFELRRTLSLPGRWSSEGRGRSVDHRRAHKRSRSLDLTTAR